MNRYALILLFVAAPSFAQSGDTAANMRAADIRSRAEGTQAGALGVSSSSQADLHLILDYLRLAQKAKDEGRGGAADKHLARGVKLAERLAKRNPEWSAAWTALARLRFESRGFLEAKAAWGQVLRIDPESEQAKAGVRACKWHIEQGG